MKFIDFAKKLVPLNDDIFDFFYEALPGYEKVGNRRILLGCWGAFQNPEVVDYTLRAHDRLGTGDVRHARRRRRRRAGHHRPGRDQPRDPDPARQLVLRGLGERSRRSCRHDPLGQSGRPAPPLEPDDDPEAAEAQPARGALQLGDEPALVQQAHGRLPAARHRRRSAGAAVGDRAGGAGRHAVRQVDGQERDDHAAQAPPSSGEVQTGVEDPALVEHHRARPRPRLLHRLRRRDGDAFRRAGAGAAARRRRARCSRTSTSPRRRSAAAFTRRFAACCRTTW